jgi:hypothetical protein
MATYAVQKDTDLTSSIDGRLLAAQLADFAEDADCLVRKLFEVGRSDAGSCFRHDGVGVECVVWAMRQKFDV